MTFPASQLAAAHDHSFQNRAEILTSTRCGCFYCRANFAPETIDHWIPDDRGDTATCPECTIDSVIGSASGLPIDDPAFLGAMHEHWFERTTNAQN